MADRVVARRAVLSVDRSAGRRHRDSLAVEEPMEIRVNGDPVAVTMRTPGHDFELALGFCLSERIVATAAAVETIRYCVDAPPGSDDPRAHGGAFNVVDVRLRSAAPVTEALRRNVYMSSSCGLCGTASIDAVRKTAASLADDRVRVTHEVLIGIPEQVRAAQRVFERTGGLHAAALLTADGALQCVREDIGRHNAVDKVLGWAATTGAWPLGGHVLFASGRVAFEIAQKALIAGVPVIAAVSAPSSLAVDLATESGMTLVGFLRGERFNVYAGAQRLVA